jgi:hypothetical protein
MVSISCMTLQVDSETGVVGWGNKSPLRNGLQVAKLQCSSAVSRDQSPEQRGASRDDDFTNGPGSRRILVIFFSV